MADNVNAVSAGRAVEALGANIKTARLKRRISVQDFAQRIGVSASTVARLEKGDGGVSIGTLAMACLVLGEIGRIADCCSSGKAFPSESIAGASPARRAAGRAKRSRWPQAMTRKELVSDARGRRRAW